MAAGGRRRCSSWRRSWRRMACAGTTGCSPRTRSPSSRWCAPGSPSATPRTYLPPDTWLLKLPLYGVVEAPAAGARPRVWVEAVVAGGGDGGTRGLGVPAAGPAADPARRAARRPAAGAGAAVRLARHAQRRDRQLPGRPAQLPQRRARPGAARHRPGRYPVPAAALARPGRGGRRAARSCSRWSGSTTRTSPTWWGGRWRSSRPVVATARRGGAGGNVGCSWSRPCWWRRWC